MPDLEQTRQQLQQLREEYTSKLAQRIDEIESGLEALASTRFLSCSATSSNSETILASGLVPLSRYFFNRASM